MKKLLVLILSIAIAVCPMLSACTNQADSTDILSFDHADESGGKHGGFSTDTKHSDDGSKLTFYCVGEYGDELCEFIKKYNKYCAVNDTYEDSVEFVYFESTAELNAVLSTELMAGKGPDILSITQGFPFEKLVRNNSLADIEKILKDNNSPLDFNDYNKVIMDSGVFDGKRLIVPLYYRADILYTTKERLTECGADTDAITFKSVFNDYTNRKPNMYFVNPYSVDSFYFSFVRQFADFKNGTTDFESKEFFTLAEDFKAALLNGKSYSDLADYEFQYTENHSEYLFTSNELYFYGGSLTDFARTYLNALANEVSPVICPNYNRKGEVTANVEIGFAINANCKKRDKVARFTEYLLSEESQGYFSGARDDSWSSGMALPVKKSAFENAVKEALEYRGFFAEDMEIDENEQRMIEKKNEALNEEYLPLTENISSVNLYGYFSQTKSYLYQNVIGEIITDYLNDKITTDKFADRLTSTVEIYMSE